MKKIRPRCSIPGCDRQAGRKPFCASHNRRLDQYGDPLAGPPIICIGGTLHDKLWRHIETEPNTGCWLWSGHITNAGYGTIELNGAPRRAHRICYEYYVGPIPESLTLDHLCRVRCCVNPKHLEPVTRGENVRRGIGADLCRERGTVRRSQKTHCDRGHEWTPENTGHYAANGLRRCNACSRIHCHEYYLKNRAKVLARNKTYGKRQTPIP